MILGTSHNKFYLVRIASKILVAVCLFLACNAWAINVQGCGASYCSGSVYPITRLSECQEKCKTVGGYIKNPGMSYPYELYGPVITNNCGYDGSYWRCSYKYTAMAYIGDATQAQRDSLTCYYSPELPSCRTPEQDCVESGLEWVDDACVDPTNCAPYREECESVGGKFTGHPVPVERSPTGCLSFCSMCNSSAQNLYRRAISKSCCDMGQVPPENVTRCLDNALAGDPEMSFSTFDCDNRGNDDCSCDYLSNENSSRYKSACIDNDFEEPNGSEGSSSSGEGEGDSTGTEPPLGPDYYPILDTIRDTLIDIKRSAKEIADCLRYGTCKGLERNDTTIVNVDGGSDSAFIKKTNVKLDSIYNIIAEGDTDIVKGLVALDSDLVKAIRQNPPLSDSSYIISTGDSISALNDTTRKWMMRIADSLGVGTDSLVAHLDSIVKHLPDTLIDSILKYQKYATDNYDSILYGAGKGFSLIDSLIDSTIKYLSQGTFTLDSTIDALGGKYEGVGDSIGAIGARLDSMYNGNGKDVSGVVDTTYNGIAGTSGFGGIYGDTVGNGTLEGIAAAAQSAYDDPSIDSLFPSVSGGDGDSSGDSIYGIPSIDSLARVLQASIDSDYVVLEDTLQHAFDSLRKDIQLIDFDSLILEPLGMKVPNTNTCPSYIFDIDLSGAGDIYSGVHGLKWPLCTPLNEIGSSGARGRSASMLPSINVMQLLRLILRIVTALSCVYIGMWFIAGKR